MTKSIKELDSYSILCDKSRAKRVLPTRRQALTKTDKGTIEMAEKSDITPELLRQLLRYEPETGKLFWRERPREFFLSQRSFVVWNIRYSNKRACNNKDSHGHLNVNVFKKRIGAHRAIWAIVYGHFPSGCIDHIDHNPSNNQLYNLRVVTHKENMKNMRLRKDNTSGVSGVSWSKSAQKWHAYIKTNEGRKNLGLFVDLASAKIARNSAMKEFQYHENHGK